MDSPKDKAAPQDTLRATTEHFWTQWEEYKRLPGRMGVIAEYEYVRNTLQMRFDERGEAVTQRFRHFLTADRSNLLTLPAHVLRSGLSQLKTLARVGLFEVWGHEQR